MILSMFLSLSAFGQPGPGSGSPPGGNPGGGMGDPCSGAHPPPGCTNTVPIEGESYVIIIALAMGIFFSVKKGKTFTLEPRERNKQLLKQ